MLLRPLLWEAKTNFSFPVQQEVHREKKEQRELEQKKQESPVLGKLWRLTFAGKTFCSRPVVRVAKTFHPRYPDFGAGKVKTDFPPKPGCYLSGGTVPFRCGHEINYLEYRSTPLSPRDNEMDSWIIKNSANFRSTVVGSTEVTPARIYCAESARARVGTV